MRNAGAAIVEPPRLQLSGLRIVATPLEGDRRPLLPSFQRIKIGLAQLFLGGKAIGELVEYYIRLDGGHAADQYNQHPFHS